MKKYILITLLLAISLFMLVNTYFDKYNELLSAQCPRDGSVASIAWKRTFPFYLVDAYLIIKGGNGEIIYKQLLLKGRDHYGDIQVEFTKMTWDCKKVSLQVNRNHYKEPLDIFPEF